MFQGTMLSLESIKDFKSAMKEDSKERQGSEDRNSVSSAGSYVGPKGVFVPTLNLEDTVKAKRVLPKPGEDPNLK